MEAFSEGSVVGLIDGLGDAVHIVGGFFTQETQLDDQGFLRGQAEEILGSA
jgi:hypothetical protein